MGLGPGSGCRRGRCSFLCSGRYGICRRRNGCANRQPAHDLIRLHDAQLSGVFQAYGERARLSIDAKDLQLSVALERALRPAHLIVRRFLTARESRERAGADQ